MNKLNAQIYIFTLPELKKDMCREKNKANIVFFKPLMVGCVHAVYWDLQRDKLPGLFNRLDHYVHFHDNMLETRTHPKVQATCVVIVFSTDPAHINIGLYNIHFLKLFCECVVYPREFNRCRWVFFFFTVWQGSLNAGFLTSPLTGFNWYWCFLFDRAQVTCCLLA